MTIFKAVLFYPMLFVRKPFIVVSKFFGILLTFVFAMTTILGALPWTARFLMLGLAFALFLLRHFYDVILLKLNPSNIDLSLYQ
ncbi:MAG: hypothetical protein WBQ42_00025 [Candidatus Rickettsiella isopodorum]